MFSDDAYNKNVVADAGDGGAGTLIGNWSEEQALREACGEGRAVAQRHQPRSGLLQDFTKTPVAFRKADNTFERVYGPKANAQLETSSGVHGKPDRHAGKIVHTGPRELALSRGREDFAEAEVQEEEAEEAKQARARRFETTTAVFHAKPDEQLQPHERTTRQHGRKNYKTEILHGPSPERTLALDNEALDHPTHAHYSNVETMTHMRMSLADPRMRSDLKASACAGMSAFGRNSEFSKPVQDFTRGLAKDEDLEIMYQSLHGTQPSRHVGGHQPRGPFASSVPSLATLKSGIHAKIAEVWGAYGYVTLRQRLFDMADHEGFVQKADATQLLRQELGLSREDAPDEALDVYLNQHVTMKKSELRIGALMLSLRPVLPQKEKRRVLEAFRALGPVNGEVRLGDWLAQLQDEELCSRLVTAFGAQEEGQVSGMPLSEQVFMELFADLAPFMSIGSLLAA